MNIRRVLREGLESYSEDYFQATISKDSKRLSNKYHGRNVIWYGWPGQMAEVHKSNVHGMYGNIYDPKKLKSLKKLIRNHPEKIEIECSYGHASRVELQSIIEHQMSVAQDTFFIDYDGYDEPYSIGDEDMDKYLGTEDIEESLGGYLSMQELKDFLEYQKAMLAQGHINEEDLRREFFAFAEEDFPLEEKDLEFLEEFIETEMRLKEMIQNQEGDLGDLSVQLRDGHHRVFAAIAAGEEYVCVNITEDTLEEYRDIIRLVN